MDVELRKTRIILVGAMVCLAAATAVAAAQTWYVAVTNSGVSDGLTWATAWTNLQRAVDQSGSGDTLCVMTGRYGIANQIVVSNKVLTIRGGYLGETPEPGARIQDAEASVLDVMGNGRVLLLVDNSDTYWQSIAFANGYTNDHGGGIRIASSSAFFTNCVIRDHQLAGSEKQGAGLFTAASSVALDHCVLSGNRSVGTGTKYGGALSQSSGNLTIRHSVILGNTATYAAAGRLLGTVTLFNCLIRNNHSSVGQGLTAHGTVRIENCSVVDTTPVGVQRTGGSLIITNSIIWNNQADVVGSPVTVTHSAFEYGSADGFNVYRDDPGFVKGYYLSDTSPYLDVGGETAENLGLDTRYAQTNQTDGGMVALGYHAASAFAIPVPDLYVAPGGNNDDPGNDPGFPLATIGHALSIAEPGARIHLAPGHYTTNSGEVFPLVMRDGPIGLLGSDADVTVIDAGGLAAQDRVIYGVDMAHGTVVSNLTVTGGHTQAHSEHGGGLSFQRSNVRIVDAVIRDNRISGGENSGGGLYGYGGTTTLIGVRVHNNRRGTGGGSTYGGGLAQRSGTLRMDRCVVQSNTGNHQGGLSLTAANVTIRNSLIVSNTPAHPARVGGLHVYSGNVSLENVTVVDNGVVGLMGGATVVNAVLWNNGIDADGSPEISYSCIGNGTFIDQGHNISDDPRFVDAAVGNYRLSRDRNPAMNSPCVDSGMNATWMADAVDLDGRPRIMPGHVLPEPLYRVDMGAYEAISPNGTLLLFQ